MTSSSEVVLDVRPILAVKQDPFETIMSTIKKMGKDQVLVLHASLKPTPLLTLMKLKGYRSHVEKLAKDHWVVKLVHKSHAQLLTDDAEAEPLDADTEESEPQEAAESTGTFYTLDNRGLEPPQPMMRTLDQLKKMRSGDRLTITNDRVPAFLLEELRQLGYPFEIEHLEDGAARVTIQKR